MVGARLNFKFQISKAAEISETPFWNRSSQFERKMKKTIMKSFIAGGGGPKTFGKGVYFKAFTQRAN